MIPVTKEEARILRELYPEYKVTRTMMQDSKRHHYYATESEGNMRAIASTNHREREIRRKRIIQQRGKHNVNGG